MSLEGVIINLNGSNYHYVGPMMDSMACVIPFCVIVQQPVRNHVHHGTLVEKHNRDFTFSIRGAVKHVIV